MCYTEADGKVDKIPEVWPAIMGGNCVAGAKREGDMGFAMSLQVWIDSLHQMLLTLGSHAGIMEKMVQDAVGCCWKCSLFFCSGGGYF